MKAFIVKTLLLAGILIVCLLSIVFFVPIQSNDYLQTYNLKCRLLEEVESPRIIFVGGSNLAFGLDSRRIEDSLHVNVINYGLHAGIGLKFMLDDVSTYVRKGDILVFAPEYGHFYDADGEAITIAPIQSVCGWKKLHLLNLKQSMNVLQGLPRILEHIIPRPYGERSYALSGFNRYGDEVKHWNLENILIAPPVLKEKTLDREFGQYFIDKIEKLTDEKQCMVVMVPPVYRETAFKVIKSQTKEIENFLASKGHPFLVSPQSHVLPDECAYDTDYHMSYEGVKRYTSSMIEILKPIVESRGR